MAGRAPLAPLALAAAVAAACGGSPAARTAPEGVVRFEVTLAESGAAVGEGTPLPFVGDNSTPVTFTVSARAVDAEGRTVESYAGPAYLRVVPALIAGGNQVPFEAGTAESFPVSFVRGFGDVRIWVEDRGTDESPGTFATGISPAIHFALPTSADLQRTTSSLTSPLDGRNVTLRAADREVVVTALAQDGFYATDLSEPGGEFASFFAFSFNRPRDLDVGDRIGYLNGNVYEYLGYTEIQYPTWRVDGEGLAPPEPVSIDEALCSADDLDLEKWESAPVEVSRLVSAFDDGDLAELCASYRDYGQWPARLVGASCGKVMVVNQYTVPDLRFEACLGETVSAPEAVELNGLRGHLRQNEFADYSQWILEVGGCDGLTDPADRARFCPDEEAAARTAMHYAGPRPAPRHFHREHPDCSGVWYPLHDED
ncbi:hypothetical protein L6R50_00425 [Myxococcota bacterium]|nr:hypothetical protein [Myxococcota bacterium]